MDVLFGALGRARNGARLLRQRTCSCAFVLPPIYNEEERTNGNSYSDAAKPTELIVVKYIYTQSTIKNLQNFAPGKLRV